MFSFNCFKKRSGLLVAALPLLFLLTACAPGPVLIKEEPNAAEQAVPVPNLEKRPFGLAEECLKLIKDGQYAKAYEYLSVDGKLSVSKKEFVDGLTACMRTGSTKNTYENMSVSNERFVGGRAVVTLINRKYSQAKPWNWCFENTRGGWKISSLDLPPISRCTDKIVEQ